MTETSGKRPRHTPIQCWGCKGDNLYREFPHIKYKVRYVHNLKQDEAVEDMGISVPRIYATLKNKKVEFQSHMIEV
jgi:hypothetical protein